MGKTLVAVGVSGLRAYCIVGTVEESTCLSVRLLTGGDSYLGSILSRALYNVGCFHYV